MIKYGLLTILLNYCYGYKILLVFPLPGKSHSILGDGYVRNLLEAGHEVTYVSPFPSKNPPANLRYVNISEITTSFSMDIFNIKNIMYKEIDLQDQEVILTAMEVLWKLTLHSEVMQEFMNDPNEKFDAVVVEWMYNELGAGLATVFDCPLIWSSSMDAHTFVLSLINEHLNPSYTFHHLSTDYSYSFMDRVHQLWIVGKVWYNKWININKENNDFKEIFSTIVQKRGRELPHIDDVRYNASLVLGNSHILTGDGIALPQNYKHIGGYHIKNTTAPLPKDLKNIMDKATDGVIYFSMGSNLKSVDIPDPIKENLLKMFSELKQTVIWKLEKELPNLPKNVHILPWAPQLSILAHTNCVLFITHGGLLSILEILQIGKPIIGIPFFADQYLNMNRAVAKGFGKRIDFDDNVHEVLKPAIIDILEDPSYGDRVKELSAIFHDHIIPPGKELVHWIEHVIKTNGAPHMRAAALRISWYKKFYLDLVLVIAIVLMLLYSIYRYWFALTQVEIRQKNKIL